MKQFEKNKCFPQSLLITEISRGQHVFRRNHHILLEIWNNDKKT